MNVHSDPPLVCHIILGVKIFFPFVASPASFPV